MNYYELTLWIGYVILLGTLVYAAIMEKSIYLGLALLGVGIIIATVVRYMAVVDAGY